MKVEHGWACLATGCHEHGAGEDADKQAEKHGKAFKHPTSSWAVPERRGDDQNGAGAGQEGPVPT